MVKGFRVAGACAVALGLVWAVPGSAQTPPNVSGIEVLSSPAQNDFKGEISRLKSSLEQLNGRITESAKEIDKLTDPKAAKAQIEQMQALVAEVLGAVADNGKVSEIGRKAIGFAEAKLKQLGSEGKFSAEERKTLVDGWSRVAGDLQGEVNTLNSVRRELSGLLRTMQQRGDFLEELQALDDGKRMLSVVRELADEMRRSSETLRSTMRSSGQPGS